MALGAGAATLIAWNFSLGVRLSTLPGASPAFRTLSGLCAFLFLPGLVIGLLGAGTLGARVLGPLAWMWPVVAVGMVVQAAWATLRGRSSVIVALPIAAFNALIAWVSVVRWLDGLGATQPAWALTPGMALSSLAALVAGDGAFPWMAAALVPALVPAAPARWRSTRVARSLVAAACATTVGLTALEAPRAFDTLSDVRTLDASAPLARSRTAPAIGVRLFGTLSEAPPVAVARQDMALADSLAVTALQVDLAADGARAATLDSVARCLELRRDSVVLLVTFDLGAAGPRERTDGAAMRVRLAAIERIVRRLHPDVLAPAARIDTGAGAPSVAWWQSYYEQAAAAARRADRDITVALATDASMTADSALVDWVMRGDSPVDAVALTVRDGGARPTQFTAALDAITRWVSRARTAPTVWIAGVSAAPAVTGETVQQHLVRRALAWSAAHAWVQGVIAGDASDGLAATGLRTAAGRARRALADVGALLRAQRDLPSAPSGADALPPHDTLAVDLRRPAPDTLPPPPP